MKVKYLKDSAGVHKGLEKELPDSIANTLISKGIVEKVSTFHKEEKFESFETKEEKVIKKKKNNK